MNNPNKTRHGNESKEGIPEFSKKVIISLKNMCEGERGLRTFPIQYQEFPKVSHAIPKEDHRIDRSTWEARVQTQWSQWFAVFAIRGSKTYF